MNTRRHIRLMVFIGLAAGLLALTPARAQLSVQWITQFGTTEADIGRAIAVDALGQSWVSGWTFGSLGSANSGNCDVFLSRISASGSVDFSRQRGGAGYDQGSGVALLGSDTVFVGGQTNSASWDGFALLGGSDGFLLRYDTSGAWQGTTRIGGAASDVVYSLAADATHLLAAGYTSSSFDGQTPAGSYDALLSMRSNTGELVWTRVAGTGGTDYAYTAALDSAGNAYFAGETAGSLGGPNAGFGYTDIVVARYDINGNRTLLKQFGSTYSDTPIDMKVDGSGNIYLVGYTGSLVLDGQINHGQGDAFVMKIGSRGQVIWTRLLGSAGADYGTGLGLDSAGHVWIGGYATSADGSTPHGAFVAQYDTDGSLLDTIWLSTSGGGVINGLAMGPDGAAYVTGYTSGTLGNSNAGGNDVFVAKIVPEPSAALLLAAGAWLLLRRRR